MLKAGKKLHAESFDAKLVLGKAQTKAAKVNKVLWNIHNFLY
jgi:hypothetical protein